MLDHDVLAVSQILMDLEYSMERSYMLYIHGFRDLAKKEMLSSLITSLLLANIYCKEGITKDPYICIDIPSTIKNILTSPDIDKTIELILNNQYKHKINNYEHVKNHYESTSQTQEQSLSESPELAPPPPTA